MKLHVLDEYQKYGTEPIDAVNISPLARFENIPNYFYFDQDILHCVCCCVLHPLLINVCSLVTLDGVSTSFWTGGNDIESEGNWVWGYPNGKTIADYVNWYENEPNKNHDYTQYVKKMFFFISVTFISSGIMST